MKTLYLIGGTMGVGKTAVSQVLKMRLSDSVFLDGDWCWDSHPFKVTEETKSMVIDNICTLLNNFLHCTAYENIIFCWVMQEQSIIDEIVSRVDADSCRIVAVSLTCTETALRARLQNDIDAGFRQPNIIDRSLARIPLYKELNTIKIDTSGKSISDIAEIIAGI